ncbi:retrotransposable element Tf2 [Tanacetum coccineum]
MVGTRGTLVNTGTSGNAVGANHEVQKDYLKHDVGRIKNGEGSSTSGNKEFQFGRITKLEFPKFHGIDVKSWLYRSQQFFSVDHVDDTDKVMFKPKSLSDTASLCKLQKVTIAAHKARQSPILPLPKPNTVGGSFGNMGGYVAPRNQTTTMALPANKTNVVNPARNGQAFALELIIYPDLQMEMCFIEGNGEEFVLPEVIGENDTPQISLNALTGLTSYRTMRVIGHFGKKKIHILVDSGITHNFLDVFMAKKLGCKIHEIDPLQVSVADGNKITSNNMCQKFSWMLNEEKFCTDVMLLPLGGCEMVLGVQWLATLGDIMWNLTSFKMQFEYEGRFVALRGTTKSLMQWFSSKQLTKHVTQKFVNLSLMSLCVPTTSTMSLNVTHQSVLEVKDKEALDDLLREFEDVFALPTSLPPQRQQDHIIPLKDDVTPVNIRSYKHPLSQKDAIESMVQELLDSKVIRPSNSPFSSPVVMVKKKDGTWRMCIDYRQLNKLTIKDKFPIPLIEELIDKLHGSKVFSKLYMRSGYHQIRMDEKDIPKPAFRTHERHYEFMVMPFGLTNAPSTFIILNEPNQRVATDPAKVSTMIDWPIPTTLKQLRGFTGLTGYYRRFIKNYAVIAQPLTALLKKNAFQWTEQATQSFQALKMAMIKAPKSYEQDSQLQILVKKIQEGNFDSLKYLWIGGQLRRKRKLMVGNDDVIRKKLVDHFHSSAEGGHFGVLATTKRNKADLAAYHGLLQPLPIPQQVWQDILMDFIDGLPASNGKTVIMVIVDRLSKYANFISMAHPYTAIQVAQMFLDNVYKLHGLPRTIVGDRDKTDGQTKAVNKTLECYLRCMIGEKPKEWKNWLPLVEFWYNTKFHSSTKTTPFEIVYGQTPPQYVTYEAGECQVAYKLELPNNAQVHSVFHVSQLKRCKTEEVVMGNFPYCNDDGLIVVTLVAVLDRRMLKKKSRVAVQLLIQWAIVLRKMLLGSFVKTFKKGFLKLPLILEDKDVVKSKVMLIAQS